MEEVDKSTMTQFREEIYHSLTGCDVKIICKYLSQESILLNLLICEQIHHHANRGELEGTILLCDAVCWCGATAFEAFVTGLEKVKKTDLVERIRTENTRLRLEQNMQPHSWQSIQPIPVIKPYNVRRGVIIVFNIKFDGKEDFRTGADISYRKLDETFAKLGYYVLLNTDGVTKNAMIEELEEKVDDFVFDAFGLIVMSHGCSEGIYDCDRNIITLHDLLEPLKKAKSPLGSLENKPVFVIAQACRAAKKDASNFIVNQNEPDIILHENVSDNPIIINSPSVINTISKTPTEDQIDSTISCANLNIEQSNDFEKNSDNTEIKSVDNLKVINLPLLDDTIIVYSAMPGEACYRRPDIGSIFIHSLCSVVEEKKTSQSFQKMLPKVTEMNRKLQLDNMVMRPTDPQISDRMSREFYFNTSICPEDA